MPIILAISSLVMWYIISIKSIRTFPQFTYPVFDYLDNPVIIINEDYRIMYCNESAFLKFFKKAENLPVIGKPIFNYHYDLYTFTRSVSEQGSTDKEILISGFSYNVNISPVLNSDNKLLFKIIVLQDITELKLSKESMRRIGDRLKDRVLKRTKELRSINTMLLAEIEERKSAEKRLNNSLEEKNTLIGEIHHRVKNNLQIINSLLKLQRKYITDEKALNAFETAISRIKSIAMVHEKLYKSDNLVNTNLAEYVYDLARYLMSSHRVDNDFIKLVFNVGNIYLDIDKCILCGLIINELIINALKYAFPKDMNDPEKENELRIDFYSEQDSENDSFGTGYKFSFIVADNGVGIPEGLDINNVDSLGFKIVNTLVKQLKGIIEINRDNGTSIKITF